MALGVLLSCRRLEWRPRWDIAPAAEVSRGLHDERFCGAGTVDNPVDRPGADGASGGGTTSAGSGGPPAGRAGAGLELAVLRRVRSPRNARLGRGRAPAGPPAADVDELASVEGGRRGEVPAGHGRRVGSPRQRLEVPRRRRRGRPAPGNRLRGQPVSPPPSVFEAGQRLGRSTRRRRGQGRPGSVHRRELGRR